MVFIGPPCTSVIYLITHQNSKSHNCEFSYRARRHCDDVLWLALYLSYLYIQFDDKTKGNPFKIQAHFPIRLHQKLNLRLGLALLAARFRSY